MNRQGNSTQTPIITMLSTVLAIGFGSGCETKSNLYARYHDAGILIADTHGVVFHNFRLRNDSDDAITINNINKSCGCTEAILDKMEIPPGEVATLRVSVSAANPKEETLQVMLDTSDPKEKQKRFALKYKVISKHIITPNKIEISEDDFNGKEACTRKIKIRTNYLANEVSNDDGRLILTEESGESCTIDGIEELPSEFDGKFTTRVQEVTIRIGKVALDKDHLRQFPLALSRDSSPLGILVMELAISDRYQLTPSAINFETMDVRHDIDSDEKKFVLRISKGNASLIELEEARGLLEIKEISRDVSDNGSTIIKYSAKLPAKSIRKLRTKGPTTGHIRIKQMGDTGPKLRWACYIGEGDEKASE
ncbi:DUF1573 domain-containing protein [Tundrisphaera sp. TA3]|uniref:DUF1573 domain-containing protein n=1 Tax=Tundrisphaera sp. TA3 TaxID=3435775 RepID=UPI003EB8E63A